MTGSGQGCNAPAMAVLNGGARAVIPEHGVSGQGQLRSVASFPIEDDHSENDTKLSNTYWTLYAHAILDQSFDCPFGHIGYRLFRAHR